jgi:hypothetical protein
MNKHKLLPMMIMMFISGLLSGMNVFVIRLSDIRININDILMTLLMCSWMLLFMGFYYVNNNWILYGLISVIIVLYFIRTQKLTTKSQFISSMIPHHSMGIKMSQGLIENNIKINQRLELLAMDIIETQNKEIEIMKSIKLQS